MSKIDIAWLTVIPIGFMIFVATCSSGARFHRKLETKQDIGVPRELSRAETEGERAADERRAAIARGEKIGPSLEDAIVHGELFSKLADAGVDLDSIRIDVDSGAVTLRGTVETADQGTKAEEIAKSVEGVKQVIDQLRTRSLSSER
jgi:hypothetical protein